MFRDGTKKSPGRRARAVLLAGATVVALGLGGLSAGSASAELTCKGASITGEGSSLQRIAQENIWTPGFNGLCAGKAAHPTVTYTVTSSGSGLKQWHANGEEGPLNTARAFIGSDDGPSAAQIANIKAAGGGADVLTIPVTQTAIAVVANPPAECSIEEINSHDIDAVMKGSYLTWSKITTATGSGCSAPIKRVVRKDGSGTTYQFKNYLSLINSTPLVCTTGGTSGKATWKELEPIGNAAGEPNINWPETCGEKTLSQVVRPGGTGGGEVVNTVNATAGSIGYAALPDAKSKGAKVILRLQNNGNAVKGALYAEAANGELANCANASYKVPTAAYESGLNADWSQVFGANTAIGGESYPLCTLTYVISLHGYGAAGFTKPQWTTVKDYLKEYVLLGGQTDLENAVGAYYAPLPTSTKHSKDVIGASRAAAAKISF